MVGIAIRFNLGRYHANPWGANVNDAAIEWPPSSWRLLRALYATARTNIQLVGLQPALDRALQALVNAPPPEFELPQTRAAHTRHYMPLLNHSRRESSKNTTKVLDGFIAVDPSAELKVWWDVTLDPNAADALEKVVSSLGYLGRSESVCSARIAPGQGPDTISAVPMGFAEVRGDQGDEWEPIDLLCPRRGEGLQTLTVSVTELRRSRFLTPPGTELVTYLVKRPQPVSKELPHTIAFAPPTIALFRLHGSARPSITEAVAVGQSLRSAVQSRYGEQNESETSSTLSGHRGDGRRKDQHRHAHYLALADRERRRVERLVVWAPESFSSAEVAALARVNHLSMHEIREPLPIAMAALANEDDLNLRQLLGPAVAWRSATPFGLVRHPKVRGGVPVDSPEDQVRRELAHRGYPQPEQVSFEKGSWHRFRGSKQGQSRLQRASLYCVRLRFSNEVRGPISLGALSHFGLGLFTPIA